MSKRSTPSLAPFARVRTTLAGLSVSSQILRQRAAPFDFDAIAPPQRRAIARGLLGALATRPSGIGLAAPMVGLSSRIVVALDGDRVLVMANPEVVASEGDPEPYPEANLCLTGVHAVVHRPPTITVRWQDLQRHDQEETFTGLTARILQHEIEILDGAMFCDHVSSDDLEVLDRSQRAAEIAAAFAGVDAPQERPMQALGVVTLPPDLLDLKDSVLRRPTADVDVDAARGYLPDLIERMLRTQYETGGVGIAAPQVGLGIRLAVIDDRERSIILLNASIVECSEEQTLSEEGCLSVPGFRGPVERPVGVRVRTQNLSGTFEEVEVDGYLARVVQHELDHLGGRLYIDHMGDPAGLRPVDPASRSADWYASAGIR